MKLKLEIEKMKLIDRFLATIPHKSAHIKESSDMFSVTFNDGTTSTFSITEVTQRQVQVFKVDGFELVLTEKN